MKGVNVHISILDAADVIGCPVDRVIDLIEEGSIRCLNKNKREELIKKENHSKCWVDIYSIESYIQQD